MTRRPLASLVAAAAVGMLLQPARTVAQSFLTQDDSHQTRAVSADALRRAINPGDRVSVLRTDGVAILGNVEQVSASGVTVVAQGLRFQLAPDSIRQIERWHRQTVRGLWVGTLIGAGLGFVIGVTASGQTGDAEKAGGAFALIGAVYGAGIGAIAGAFNQGREVVYTAPPSTFAIVIAPHGARIHVKLRF